MKQFKCALRVFLFMTVLTGLIYPLLITIIAQLMMPKQSNGSLVQKNDQIIGSTLIAQNTTENRYFWSRPSAIDYDPMKPSGGSNYGPTSQKLVDILIQRKNKIGQNAPSELLYASGSGLDPHISLDAAYFQVDRVAKARSMDPSEIKEIINAQRQGKQLGFMGPYYINVLSLNLTLDERYNGRR